MGDPCRPKKPDLFTHDLSRLFVVPQPGKARMSQVTVRRSLREFDLGHELGPQPAAVFHFVFC
jgi:hypothetical protein